MTHDIKTRLILFILHTLAFLSGFNLFKVHVTSDSHDYDKTYIRKVLKESLEMTRSSQTESLISVSCVL